MIERTPIRSLDEVIGYIGAPRAGKTAMAAGELSAFQGFALVHDPSEDFPTRLPDGELLDVYQHSTLRSAARGFRRRPEAIHACSFDVEQVIALAKELVAGTTRGTDAIPVALLIDESVSWEEAKGGRRQMGPQAADLIARRRRLHISLRYCAQFAGQIRSELLALATRLCVFRLRDTDDISRLRRRGMPDELLAKVPTLAQYEHVEWDAAAFPRAPHSPQDEPAGQPAPIVPRSV